jgi:hypothetical protein
MTGRVLNCCLSGVLLALTAFAWPSAGSATDFTQAEVDAARNLIAECWYLDPTIHYASEMIVDVRTVLSPDGVVLSAEILGKARMAADSDYRGVAEAAVRAVKKCSPLHMPTGKHDTWKVTVFHFNPRGMLNQ